MLVVPIHFHLQPEDVQLWLRRLEKSSANADWEQDPAVRREQADRLREAEEAMKHLD